MLVGNIKDVEPQQTAMPGSKGAFTQWLLAQPQGAENFYMRRIIIEEGGLVPEHEHPEEHEIYILAGRGRIEAEGQVSEVKPGDFVFISGGQKHSFTNEGQGEFSFICCIPVLRE